MDQQWSSWRIYFPSRSAGFCCNGASVLDQVGAFGCLDSEDPLLDWDFSKLVDFSKFLGLLVKGFEEEIWILLRKLRIKFGHGTLSKVQKKKPLSSSCFKRELRRLDCSFNYGGSTLLSRRSSKNNWELVPVD